jgi:short-chain Z-isoprenyl diphosphate synthase
MNLVYRLYGQRLRRRLLGGPLPQHVAIVMDGNRRWARQQGFTNPSIGHRYGAQHVDQVLEWCMELGIEYVTVYACSSDNLRKRDPDEILHLTQMIEELVAQRLATSLSAWRIHVAGRLDELPDTTSHALKHAVEETRERTPFHLTIAIGYDGRQEIVDAVRSLLDVEARAGATPAELAAVITADDIAAHLYTAGRPDPDMVIRTSGEARLSGFLMWQAANAELYFCDVSGQDSATSTSSGRCVSTPTDNAFEST